MQKKIGISDIEYADKLNKYKAFIIYRGTIEIEYWKIKINEIREYSREQAIEELIKAKKLEEKISAINVYIDKLKNKR